MDAITLRADGDPTATLDLPSLTFQPGASATWPSVPSAIALTDVSP